MVSRRSAYRGCLLGLAVGDAMGYTIDTKSWAEIREDYGPNGLLGYDLANGYAEISSYTQLAAFTANGLLYGCRELIDRMEAELGTPCRIVATGGLASSITPFCRHEIVCDDDLLLRGMWYLYVKNK